MFLINYINDLDEGVSSNLLKFADYTNLYKSINDNQNAELLQEDLNKLVSWGKTWQMSFNVSKCKTMHIGSSKLCYSMDNTILVTVDEEKDLGVVISSSLKPSSQCCQESK